MHKPELNRIGDGHTKAILKLLIEDLKNKVMDFRKKLAELGVELEPEPEEQI